MESMIEKNAKVNEPGPYNNRIFNQVNEDGFSMSGSQNKYDQESNK